MSFRVSITPPGQRSVKALRGKARRSFDAAAERLASQGCKAGEYRLTGEDVEHICAIHLYGRHRVFVAFPDRESVVVLLVGEHLAGDPELDIYRSLYHLFEYDEPTAKRTKPPCCEPTGTPPVDPQLLDRFYDRARELAKRNRRAT